jgi:hypothetical protein
MYPLLGLNLLRLLAQNRISEFHTQLELIEPEQIQSNIYIKHPVQLEQSIMEGRYNKVSNLENLYFSQLFNYCFSLMSFSFTQTVIYHWILYTVSLLYCVDLCFCFI